MNIRLKPSLKEYCQLLENSKGADVKPPENCLNIPISVLKEYQHDSITLTPAGAYYNDRLCSIITV